MKLLIALAVFSLVGCTSTMQQEPTGLAARLQQPGVVLLDAVRVVDCGKKAYIITLCKPLNTPKMRSNEQVCSEIENMM